MAASRISFMAYGDVRVSVDLVLIIPIIVFFGPPGIALAMPFGALSARYRPSQLREFFHYLTLTNAARFVILGTVAATVYEHLAPVNPDRVTWVMVPVVLLVAAVIYLLNLVFFIGSLNLRKGHSPADVFANYLWLAPHRLVLALMGLALVTSYLAVGYPGVLAFCAPALMMRLVQKQYVDKTEESVEQLREKNAALVRANVEISSVHEELRVTYDATLEALVGALDARDQETKGHSVRVAQYMLTIAEALGVKRGSEEWTNMQRGALLHDVGKIGVSDNILLKPGKLTPEEWADMRRHPEIGYNILRDVRFLAGAADIVLAHHERWDGEGYPRGLRGDEIPLGSRIFTVVDTFDSMTSDRPYRKALNAKAALDEILRCGGTQFDPLVVEAFLDIYEKWVVEREQLHGKVVAAAA
jgi:putative nucleotidyltransferase with HDIG domain